MISEAVMLPFLVELLTYNSSPNTEEKNKPNRQERR